MIKRKSAFTWGKISRKQLQLLTWWREGSPVKDCDGIVADGAIRSTKTLSMSISFLEWAHATFQDGIVGASGKTIKSFERNVLNQLKQVALGRGYTFKHNKSDSFVIFSKGGNTVRLYIFGGKDESSQHLVQGITLAGFLFDEVALQPQSFVNQAVARCSVTGSKLWYNCNPSSPFHFVKTDIIDRCDELNLVHIHTTMEDNLTLDEKIKDRYRRMYSGVFFKRYILGLWCQADGLIFDCFDSERHVVKSKDKYNHYAIGMDYGTSNACVFLLFGWDDKDNVQVVKEYYYSAKVTKKQKTDSEYADDMIEFCSKNKSIEIIIDPSALSFKTELRKRGFTNVRDAKNDVLDGIRFHASMLHDEKLQVDPSCKGMIKEYSAYVWDEKAQLRGEDKPSKDFDHAMDACRYMLFTKFGRAYGVPSVEFRV